MADDRRDRPTSNGEDADHFSFADANILQRPQSSGIDPAAGFTFAAPAPLQFGFWKAPNALSSTTSQKTDQAGPSSVQQTSHGNPDDDTTSDIISDAPPRPSTTSPVQQASMGPPPSASLPRSRPSSEPLDLPSTGRSISTDETDAQQPFSPAESRVSSPGHSHADSEDLGRRLDGHQGRENPHHALRASNKQLPLQHQLETPVDDDTKPPSPPRSPAHSYITSRDERQAEVGTASKRGPRDIATLGLPADENANSKPVPHEDRGERKRHRARTPSDKMTYAQLLEALEFRRKDDASASVRRYEEMVEHFGKELSDLNDDYVRSEAEVKKLQEKLQAAESKVETTTSELNNVKRSASQFNVTAQTLRERLKATEQAKIKLTQHCDKIKRNLDKLTEQHKDTEHQEKMARESIDDFVEENDKLKQSVEEAKREAAVWKTKQEQLEVIFQEKSAMLTEQRYANLLVQQRLDKAISRYQQLEKRIDASREQGHSDTSDLIDELRSRLAVEFETLQQNSSVKLSSIDSTLASLSEKGQTALSKGFAELKQHVEQSAKEQQATTADAAQKLELLTESVKAAQSVNDQLKGLHEDVASCRDRSDGFAASASSMTAKYHAEVTQTTTLKQELTSLRQSLSRALGSDGNGEADDGKLVAKVGHLVSQQSNAQSIQDLINRVLEESDKQRRLLISEHEARQKETLLVMTQKHHDEIVALQTRNSVASTEREGALKTLKDSQALVKKHEQRALTAEKSVGELRLKVDSLHAKVTGLLESASAKDVSNASPAVPGTVPIAAESKTGPGISEVHHQHVAQPETSDEQNVTDASTTVGEPPRKKTIVLKVPQESGPKTQESGSKADSVSTSDKALSELPNTEKNSSAPAAVPDTPKQKSKRGHPLDFSKENTPPPAKQAKTTTTRSARPKKKST